MRGVGSFEGFEMCKGVSGMWNYHLRAEGSGSVKSLCGRQVMACNAPIDTWGFRSAHLLESYCEWCEKIANGQEIKSM